MSPNADPRTIITPYAFDIAPQLLNRPLASPWRRGLALCIDLLMVVILAELPDSLLLAIVLAVAWVRLRGYRIRGKMQTAIFIGFGLWLMLDLIFVTFQGETQPTGSASAPTITLEQSTEFNPFCPPEDALCLIKVMADVTAKLVSQELTTEAQVAGYLAERYDLNAVQAQQVAAEIMGEADKATASSASIEILDDRSPTAADGAAAEPEQEPDPLVDAMESESDTDLVEDDQEPERFSTIAVVKGIIEDLGLGLGWASIYFTVFTAWFHGQTLGKKMLAIRVTQLDNKPLSLWGAFGRYGGYGAGLTTGLMGFFQIFWDPNRQGIHDKISSTVVVDLRAKARKRARAERSKVMANQKEQNG